MTHQPSRKATLALSALLLAGAVASAQDAEGSGGAPAAPAQGVYFFEQDVPKGVSTSTGSLSVSGITYKDGKQSLRWQYQPGSQLTVSAPVDIIKDEINPRTFLVWMYNAKPSAGELRFQFSQGAEAGPGFSVPLDFSGWRGLAVPFRDMPGTARGTLDRLTITAPASAGELYFDQLLLNVPVDNRWAVPDRTAPFVNPSVNTAVNKNWNGLLMYDELLSRNLPKATVTAYNDTEGDTAGLFKRAEEVLGTGPKLTPEAVDKLLKDYAALKIKQEASGTITGPALTFPAHLQYAQAAGVFSDADKALLTGNTNNLRTLGLALLQTARFLRNPDLTPAQRTALEGQYLLTTRYILDQGLTYGSAYQIIHHLGYQSREVFDAWFLGRRLLAENGLLDQTARTLLWYNGAGQVFTPPAELNEANVDILNTQLQWMIKGALMLPDPGQRAALLKGISRWLSETVVRSGEGLVGGFKSDGSVFHHAQQYVAYARDAYSGLSPAVYALSGSPYAISRPALSRLSDNLYKMAVYGKGTRIPLPLTGRHPNERFKIASDPFRWLALSGDPATGKGVNEPLAATFARLTDKPDFAGVAASKEPVGAWAMNYASMAVQRREDPATPGKSWLAVARGFSRYLVGNESYEANNLYGRYLMYGALQIVAADPERYSFSSAGWDWNRYPGTTSVALPWEDLKAKLVQLPAAGIEEMLLSTETYVGANVLGDNSMFAMKLHGHAKYGQDSLYARKSYFMFDNRIVALGSGIQDDDAQHSTITTLFQNTVTKNEPMTVGDKDINTPGSKDQLTGGAASLVDPAGNAYFLPAGQTVNVTYGPQSSPDELTGKMAQGNFATAWIDHGKAPKDASYEYAVLVGASKGAAAPAYTVLSRSVALHAVRDNATGGESYAFFEAGDALTKGTFVRSSSAPNMVMAAPNGSGWKLSVVNPDLALYSGTEPDQVDANGKPVKAQAAQQPQQPAVDRRTVDQLTEALKAKNVEIPDGAKRDDLVKLAAEHGA